MNHAIDVTQADFEDKVIEASFTQAVVIDFWAPWCAPCKVLKPLLEKLAEEYGGKFLLAKVNSDENPELSQRFGVRGIPAVKAIIDGRVVDEFTGALPEGQVRAWLGKFILSEAEELRRSAQQQAAAGDIEGALQQLSQASQLEPNNEWVRVDAAELLYSKGEAHEAEQLLGTLKDIDVLKDARVLQLMAQVRLGSAQAAGGNEAELHAAIALDENDLESRLQLANLLVATHRVAEGMDQLLEIVRRDRNFREDIGRKTLLDVFNLLGGQGDLVSEYRRKLSSALN